MASKFLLLLVLFSSLQVSASDILDRCELNTNKPELQNALNKETICQEVLNVLFPANIVEYDYYLRIEANGYQTMYSVELTQIEAFIGNDRVFNETGVLHWNPDSSKVVLD